MSVLLRTLAVIGPLLTAGVAAAEPAGTAPAPRGGLFGLFSNSGPSQTKPSPDVSGTPASNSSYWTDTKGGSVIGLTGIETPEQCAGKLCNLYYGDAPDEAEQAAAPVLPSFDPNVPTTAAESEATPGRRGIEMAEDRPSCAPSPQDPWRCYRK